MKLRVRRVGNSLGVIVPKAVLERWRRREGDFLELAGDAIRPCRSRVGTHDALDDLKHKLALLVIERCSAQRIRAQSLANLHRWKSRGSWVSAYDEWQAILERGDDGELFAAMLGRDERSNRLRQSPPYVGLLPREEVSRLNEEAST